MKFHRNKRPAVIAAVLILAAARPLLAETGISIDRSDATDWKISNGILSVDWNSRTGHVYSMHLAGRGDDLIDVTNTSGGQPKGLYMDNTGLGAGVTTADYFVEPGNYIDWWITTGSNSANPFTYSQHFILRADDPGIHVYFVVHHGPDDIAGNLGQIQFVFRVNLSLFTNTYAVNTGLNNIGASITPLQGPPLDGVSDPGRQVQDATVDLHGLPLAPGYRRQFYTKYDYSSFEYLHRAHGVYGADLAAWAVLPSAESGVGGPTKQNLIFTNNILIMEVQSNHLDNGLPFPVAAGALLNRLYGPFYFHFNQFDDHHTSPASLYREALHSRQWLRAFYDDERPLLDSGYIDSGHRGRARAVLPGAEWAILSDEHTDFQYSHAGRQYWTRIRPDGVANFHRVVPGSYRLSAFALGKWGELRMDGVTVAANQTTSVAMAFHPENFGDAPPVWTIGSPDRSAHEFLHGHIVEPVDLDPQYPFDPVQDDRQYLGQLELLGRFRGHNGRGGLLCYRRWIEPGN